MVHKSQNLFKVKVLLLALHPEVVEGQVNHIHPRRESKEMGPRRSRGQLEEEERENRERTAVSLNQAPPSHHRRGSLSMYSGPWLHTEQKNR